MDEQEFEKVKSEILRFYQEQLDVENIADVLEIPRFMVESVLISELKVQFR
ncbi:hypothetical protein [Brevibacillus reuszeri]|uniref:hypothetical protein n=1 Tax=Brevibacillus reuszeri TaxID=54915 RepID=UPI0013DF45C5|nr:hypothetical protein [Brevibacillus reuszeri]